MGEKYRCTKSREIEISDTWGTRRIEETFPSPHVIHNVHNTMSAAGWNVVRFGGITFAKENATL